MTISGGADNDTATWNTTTEVGALSVTAETINLNSGTVNTGAGNQTYNGSVTLGTANVLTGAQISLDAVDLGSNSLTIINSGNSEITGVLEGTGGLIKQGTGTLTLSGNNTFSGATRIDAGNLDISHDNALGTTAGSTSINGGIFRIHHFKGIRSNSANRHVSCITLVWDPTPRLLPCWQRRNVNEGCVAARGLHLLDSGDVK